MDAFERRLRSIYEAFDSRNPKVAVRLANIALQKHKDSQILRVLKGLALQCMDRAKEAFEVCDQVLSEAPTDEQVLSILAMVYKSKAHQAKLTSAYETAIKARPNDVNHLVVLLSQYTRALDFVKQQQTAMKLHRLDRSSGDYIWWIVTSLVLQARAAGQGSGNGEKLLQLAQSMATKQLEGGSEQGNPVNSLLLYHSILQERKHNKEALEAVKGPLGEAFNTVGERELVEARLTAELGDREAAASLYRQVALRNPQNWAAIQGHLDCVAPRESATTATNGTADLSSLSILANESSAKEHLNGTVPGGKADSFQEAEVFAKELEAAVSGGAAAKQRGPLLAAVELEARRLSHAQRIHSGRVAGPSGQHPGAAADTPDLAAAILRYFEHLGHLASCASDLRPYSATVEDSSRAWLQSAMHSHCKAQESGESVAPKPADVQRRVSAFQVEHDLGLPEYHSLEDAEAHARELVYVYRQAAVLESGLDEKERGCADGLVALAAGALLTAWKLEAAPRRPHRLLKAVLVLEAAQVARRVSAPLRLAAMGLYSLLGAPGMAVENFTALDIKHIQHDTLSGHWLLPSLLGTLRADLADQLLTACRGLYEDHCRDAGDTVLAAFQAGSFTKVLEFVRFKERLANSHARAVFHVESAVLSLTSTSPAPAAAAAQVQETVRGAVAQLQASLPAGMLQDGQATNVLRFNEDLSTRPAWLPPDSGQPNLALARWWYSHLQHPIPGYGRCWWACALAAECTAPEAAGHRAAAMASLQQRSLLPSLLLHATSSNHAAAATALKDMVEWLARLQGLPSLESLRERTSAPQLSTVALPQLCALLHLATFAAASSVQASLSRPGEEAPLQEAVEQLGRMDSAAAALSDRLCAELELAASSPLVAMGPLVFVAAAFANEEAYWTALCLQAWTSPLKRRKKGKKAGADGSDSTGAAHDALQERLRTSGEVLAKHLQGLREAVAERSTADGEQAHVLDTLLSELAADEEAAFRESLWAWESRMAPRQVMEGVLQEQNALINSVVMRLDRALAILSSCGP